MRKAIRILLLGVAVWAVPFALGMALFPVPDGMRMAPDAYMADIGLTYVMIPIIAAGIGYALARK
jgi:hypothetical protein